MGKAQRRAGLTDKNKNRLAKSFPCAPAWHTWSSLRCASGTYWCRGKGDALPGRTPPPGAPPCVSEERETREAAVRRRAHRDGFGSRHSGRSNTPVEWRGLVTCTGLNETFCFDGCYLILSFRELHGGLFEIWKHRTNPLRRGRANTTTFRRPVLIYYYDRIVQIGERRWATSAASATAAEVAKRFTAKGWL